MSSDCQAIVNAACDQVQCVILDQMVLEEQQKLTQDQDMYQTLKEQQLKERIPSKKPQLNLSRKPKKPSMARLQEELSLLQANVAQLCSLMETSKTNPPSELDHSYHLHDI